MKRKGNLMARISELENLEWAYWKAQRGKRSKKEVIAFDKNVTENFLSIQESLRSGNIEVGNYHFFKIYDPKERQICAASFTERILHHAIMNICHSSFEDFQVYDSYATRIGKGTDAAIKRAAGFQKKYSYFLKIDCRKYFDSIDHTILKVQLNKRFKDEALLELIFKIIDSYEVNEGKGLPIGNLTSQYFANHYLAHADRFLAETLKVPAMVRYMDDLLIWHNSSTELRHIATVIRQFCEDKLAITFKHCYQNKTSHGVSFLGVKLFPTHTELSKKSKERLKVSYSKLNAKFMHSAISEQEFQNHLIPLFVRPLKVKSYRFRNQLLWNTG